MDIDRKTLTLPFREFMDTLKLHGFVIGVDHYLRLQTILRQFGPHTPPEKLKTLLCPMFAVNQKQQDLFYRLFDRHVNVNTSFMDEWEDEKAPAVKSRELSESSGEPWSSKPWVWIVCCILIIAGVAAGLWKNLPVKKVAVPPVSQPLPEKTTIIPDNTPNVNQTVSEPVKPKPQPTVIPPLPENQRKPDVEITLPFKEQPVPELSWYQMYFRHVQIMGAFIPLLLFLMHEGYLRKKRRLVLEQSRAKRKRKTPPFIWHIRVPSPPPSSVKDNRFYTAANRMRTRMDSDIRRLDMDASVTASINQAGFPTLCYESVKKAPEYLFLIDLAMHGNHFTQYVDTLADTLASEGIFVTRYFYKDDPQICLPRPGEKWVAVNSIVDRYRHCRLIIIGDGEAMIDPLQGVLEPWTILFRAWKDRAVLTPRIPKEWGGTEISLARDFIVLPATLDGMAALVDHFESPFRLNLKTWAKRDKQPLVPEPDQLKTIASLKAYLEDNDKDKDKDKATFKWLCACAVYPELTWNLTLHLGITLLNRTRIDQEKLLRLVRLPWFHEGRIPEDIRLSLIAKLDPDTFNQVRRSIFQVLKQNPPPEKSGAYDVYRLNLAAYTIAETRREKKYRREQIGKTLAGMTETQIPRDITLIRFLESNAVSLLALDLPKKLYKVFFRNGIPFFGVKTLVRALFYAFVAAVFMLLPKPVIPPIPAHEPYTMRFSYIPPGSFMMGSSEGKLGRPIVEDQRNVVIAKGFYLQTTEVTQGQWKAAMGSNPSYFQKCGDHCPVEQVSWDDAQAFIQTLNRRGEKKYRLPTEAEWEYAARAGSTTSFANGPISKRECEKDPNLDVMGWYCGNSNDKTHPVKQKKANAWGLHDMHGNVYEWVEDDYHFSYNGAPDDGSAWVDTPRSSNRVVRSGSWNSPVWFCRAAYRFGNESGPRFNNVGFRVVLLSGQQEEDKQPGEIDGTISDTNVPEDQMPDLTNAAEPEGEGLRPGGLETVNHLTEAAAETNVDAEILTPQSIRQAQDYLQRLGLNPGPADGIMGPKTTTAIQTFQARQGLTITSKPDDQTLQALKKAVDDLSNPPAEPSNDLIEMTPDSSTSDDLIAEDQQQIPDEASHLRSGVPITAPIMVGASVPARPVEETKTIPEKPTMESKPSDQTNTEIRVTEQKGIPMTFAYIPSGSFVMGSPEDELGRQGDEDQHKVSISRGFLLQATEVTQGQWQAVMGSNPSYFKQCGDDCPVEMVSWDDVKVFIQKLNLKGDKKYRLPTEAEWEYAARAGSTTAFANGPIMHTVCDKDPNLDAMGWYCGNANDKTHPVRQKDANAWRLYDMHGNVFEWVEDDYHDSYEGAPVDGEAWVDSPRGSYRVFRGGAWPNTSGLCRAAYRDGYVPDSRYNNLGFRLVQLPVQPSADKEDADSRSSIGPTPEGSVWEWDGDTDGDGDGGF